MTKDYINKQGLSVALGQLRALCMTKAEGTEILELLGMVADAIAFPEFQLTIPANGWQTGAAGEFAVFLDVAAEVTAADGTDVVLTPESVSVAQSCGLSPTVETLDGYLRFRAVSAPDQSMTGIYRVLRGPASEEAE